MSISQSTSKRVSKSNRMMSFDEWQKVMTALEKTEEIRNILGYQYITDSLNIDLLTLHIAYDALGIDDSWQLIQFFSYGFIQGKRAERQRRKQRKSE